MRKLLIAVLPWLLLTTGGQAVGQTISTTMLGTLNATAHSDFTNGKLSACSIQFGVLTRDWKYKAGGFITITGSFGLMEVKDKVATVLKVVLHDVDPRDMKFIPSPPASAYFVSDNLTTSKQHQVESYNSDTPGALFTIFQLQPTFSFITKGLKKDQVTIAFNRKADGMDIQVPIDVTVEDTSNDGSRRRSTKAKEEFAQCALSLLEGGARGQ
jgi:hypothetical protein